MCIIRYRLGKNISVPRLHLILGLKDDITMAMELYVTIGSVVCMLDFCARYVDTVRFQDGLERGNPILLCLKKAGHFLRQGEY